VDIPGQGVDTVWNDKASGVLNIGAYALDRSRSGKATSRRISNLLNASEAVLSFFARTLVLKLLTSNY
jgi:hypothetical protein